MTVTDQPKIIDNKIKPILAQYDLGRLVAKIYPYSGDLRKYEYLTDEDLGYKPSVLEKAKFEYSPLGKFFNKGLKEEEKKEELLKSVKNIGDKNEELLKSIEDKKAVKGNWKSRRETIRCNWKKDNLKDDKAKNKAVLKDGLKELIKSYPDSFSNFVKSELKQLPTSEEKLTTKGCLKRFFLMALVFLKDIVRLTYF